MYFRLVSSTAAMFPMRVVVEATADGGDCVKCATGGQCVVDAFTMINGTTPVDQLVSSTLQSLGLGHLQSQARAVIEVNNWKPIPIETIVDSTSSTASSTESLLKDVSTHATLRIITKPCVSAVIVMIIANVPDRTPPFSRWYEKCATVCCARSSIDRRTSSQRSRTTS